MSLGKLRKTGWTGSHHTSAQHRHFRLASAKRTLKGCRDSSLAVPHTCLGPTDTQCLVSSAKAHVEQEPCVTRRCALGGLASGLTLVSMPASAKYREAGAYCSYRLTLHIKVACYHGQALDFEHHMH